MLSRVPQDLHLEILQKYKITLKPDGNVTCKGFVLYFDEDIVLGFRDEGPDAWATSHTLPGPVWCWDAYNGWEFYEKEVKITGYYGMSFIVVTIQKDGVHVTKCRV